MICLDMSINGTTSLRVGIANASMLSPTISAFVGADDPAGLFISGMCDLANNRNAHVYWGEVLSLLPGNFVRFALVDGDCPTKPSEIKATDSPEYLEEQRQFEEAERAYVPPISPAIRRWPSVAFECSINGEHRATATLAEDEEHILCSLLWDRWRPHQCRIFVRSFGGSTKHGRKRQTEWLRASLSIDDAFELYVRA